MEAVAKYSYQAGTDAELSFNVGDKMKIIPVDDDWCRGRIHGAEGFVPKAYISEKPHPWFKGYIGRDQSEELLLKKDRMGNFIHPDGAFLIRHSENSPGDFSASVKYNNSVQHFKIFTRDDKYYVWTTAFDSFNELVEYHRTNSISRSNTIKLKDMIEENSNNKSNVLRYQGAYDFRSEDESELSFCKGDILKIIDSNDQDWWRAEKDGEVGLVPARYLIPYKG